MGKPRKKAMRRAYLKVWSNGYINTGSRDDAARRYSTTVMQDVVARHRHEEDAPVRFPDDPVPRVSSHPRADALALAQSLSDVLGTVRIEHKIVLRKTKYEETCMFYGMKGQSCLIIQVLHDVIVKRSTIFDSRIKAIDSYKSGRIIWVEQRNIATV